MKLSDLKEVNELASNLLVDFRELLVNLIEKKTDFEVDNYRFIASDSIDEIQQDELKGDLYILGCFNSEFLAEQTNLPLKAIQALQKAEAFEELGELVVGDIEAIQEGYKDADGYGHHFAQYDGEENEIEIDGTTYYYFRKN